ncbi:MAG TPA: hypothetical protein VMW53_07410 [archaeon]|nr:hypothetical protein [archaeon]
MKKLIKELEDAKHRLTVEEVLDLIIQLLEKIVKKLTEEER